MTTKYQKTNRENPGAAGGVDDVPGNARDREMGRTDTPLGDLGDTKTWEPPKGEQGMSNRPGDEQDLAANEDEDEEDVDDEDEFEDDEDDGDDEDENGSPDADET